MRGVRCQPTGSSSALSSGPRSEPGTRTEVSVAPSRKVWAGWYPHGSRSACSNSNTSPRLLDLKLPLGLRLERSDQPLTAEWQALPIRARGSTVLGVSFRPRQVEAFGLDGPATLRRLLAHPFQIIRLGAYWNRIETSQGGFDTSELDWQLDAAERVGKQVILAVGAVKNFGYPEVFMPKHYEAEPLREGRLVTPPTRSASSTPGGSAYRLSNASSRLCVRPIPPGR